MKAVILEKTCTAKELTVSNVPIPKVKPGWVLVKIKAFGINRSELIMRSVEGDAGYISLPRILGIECVGEISDSSDSEFKKGQHVVALMGGMGRSFDGGYAEYALLPQKNVFTVETDMSWEELAAVPETYFTVYGSLFHCLQIESSDTLLIRGGTSAAGLVAIQLAKCIGSVVLATTRKSENLEILKQHGADYALIDDGTILEQLHYVYPDGVTKVLEFIGPSTLKESMKCLSNHGVICITGILGGAMDNFDPIKDIINGIYLCSFFSNYPTQKSIDDIFCYIKKYNLKPPIAKVFSLKDVASAHLLLENNMAMGKVVVLVD
ncbi:zinc-binding dehydrogenase [Clostridium akagii]|uniref:zinc-binding dehydrogenase n=1 Tax=Clostridium akagii TaxID=91623 RepID=UPI00047889A9|nr:zinc-binding dehydrogenase [Clostridium akagii]